MDEFYSIISKETGISVKELKDNWLMEETLNERCKAWEESNKDPFYIDMALQHNVKRKDYKEFLFFIVQALVKLFTRAAALVPKFTCFMRGE